MATTGPITPDANDAYVSCSDATWTKCYDATGTLVRAGSYLDYVDVGYGTDPKCMQAFFKFDTTSIPSGSTVSAATLTVTCQNYNSLLVAGVLEVYPYIWSEDGESNVATASFRSSTNLTSLYNSGNGLFASHDATWGAWDTIGANTPHVLDTGPSAASGIVVNGTTRLMLSFASNRTETQPGNNCNFRLCSANHATSSYRPTLNVTYTAPAGPVEWAGLTVIRDVSS